MTSALVVEDLRQSGKLHELIAQSALEGIGPMVGDDGLFVGEVPLPWHEPPEVISVMSMTEMNSNVKCLAWIGGSFDALATVAEALLGERPVEEDEMFEDCVRELSNIVSGRFQELMQANGVSMALGLPIYISGAKRLHVGATLVQGAAVRLRFTLPGEPELDAGYATEEER